MRHCYRLSFGWLDSLLDFTLEKAKDPKESTPPEDNPAQQSEGQQEAEPPHTNTGKHPGCVNELESIDLCIGQVSPNAGVFDSSNAILVQDLGDACEWGHSGPFIGKNSKDESDSGTSNLRNLGSMSKLSSPIMSLMQLSEDESGSECIPHFNKSDD